MTLLLGDKSISNIHVEGYDLLGTYLISDIPTSFDCRKLLRVIHYIQSGIALVCPWEEEIGNVFFVSLKEDYAIIGSFDEGYLPNQSPDLPVNIVPYSIFIQVLNEWKEICEQHESECFSSSGDALLGQCIYGIVVACGNEDIMLEYESKHVFLHKSDIFWELRYATYKDYARIGDKLFVKIIEKKENNIYLASMMAAQPEKNPMLEPNLVRGAIWKGTVTQCKTQKNCIKYFVDIFPGCWGFFYESMGRTFFKGEQVTVRVLDIQWLVAYSQYANYCNMTLQLVRNKEC